MKKPVELNQEETKQVVGGATAVEYGLVAAQIGVAIVAAIGKVGQAVGDKFKQIQGQVASK